MPVPSTIDDLSPTPGSNYPAGSESPAGIDDYLRFHAACIAQERDALGPLLTGSVNTAATIRALLGVPATADVAEPPGVMKQFAGATAPSGWLLCNGSAVSRTTYAALFAAIGTAFGTGDGVTTFNVPNTQNRVLVGAGGLYSRGATGGSKDAIVVSHTHTGATGAAGDHSHSLRGASTAADTKGLVEGSATAVQGGSSFASLGYYSNVGSGGQAVGNSGNHNHAFTTDSTGSSGTDANMPPYLAVNMIIKV